jgi:hypothetical protein
VAMQYGCVGDNRHTLSRASLLRDRSPAHTQVYCMLLRAG